MFPFSHRSWLLAAGACLVFTAGARAGGPSHIPADYPGKPLSGAPQAIPGTIQAESYDVAPGDPKGVTVQLNGKLNKSDLRPVADGVGIGRVDASHVSTGGQPEAPGQAYVGWTETGEWLAYTVEVKEAGTYAVGGKFAAGGKGSLLSFTFSPELTTGPIEIPTTAGYQPAVEVYHVWETLADLKEIALPAGVYVMKVKIEADRGLNMDFFTFTKKR